MPALIKMLSKVLVARSLFLVPIAIAAALV